jgi:outer membrane lipoprotein-sorting protein
MKRYLVFLIAALWIPLHALADSPEQKAKAIFDEAAARGKGFVDVVSTTKMISKEKGKVISERVLDIKSLETPEDVRTLLVFQEPKREKGIALLTITKHEGDAEQWLYIPSLKRVKKMAGQNKSGPFMGSEFSFEDLGFSAGDSYSQKYVKDEPVDGADCYVIESTPKDKYSGYSKIIAWIDKKELFGRKSEFYDLKGQLLKTLTPAEYKLLEQKYWRPTTVSMVNHQTQNETQFILEKIKFKNGLKADEFNEIALSK